MLTLLRIMNLVLLVALAGCIAGALAGLIVLAPFVGGAWLLNAVALAGYEEAARPGWTERASPESAPEPRLRRESHAVPEGAPSVDDNPDEVDALPATGII
jgi:hypothetical protein